MVAHVDIPFNDRALRGNGTFTLLQVKNIGDRVVVKYMLDDSLPPTLDRAVRIIQDLLRDNPTFCETFSMETLRAELMNKQYLTINGMAVCIAEDQCEKKPWCKDRYFTESTLVHPVRCPQGHYMEGDLLPWWEQKKGNICPAGIGRDNHSIDPRVVDEERRADIQDYIESKNPDRKRFEQRKDTITKFELKIADVLKLLLTKKEKSMSVIKTVDVGKVLVKGGEIPVVERTAQEVVKKIRGFFSKMGKQALEKSEKKVVESTAKAVSQWIPFVCVVMGTYNAYLRFVERQYWRGVGEVVSVFANSAGFVFPPAVVGGPIISIVLDAGMLGADIAEYGSAPSTQTVETRPLAIVIQFDLESSYCVLKFGSNPTPPPTQAEVDVVFTHLTQSIQLQDLVGIEVPENWLQKSNRCMAVLQSAREIIYQNRGWVIGP